MGLFGRKKSLVEFGVLEGATDHHSHILFGVDDGVASLDESLQILSFYESHSLKDLWLTPHVMEDIPNTTDALKARFEELFHAYIPEGECGNSRVRLHLAAEYMLDMIFEERLENNDFLTMEDNRVLVETSFLQPPYDLYGKLSRLMSAGYRPLLAHVERYHYMKKEDYEKLHGMGVEMQLNVGSLLGYYGQGAQHRAEHILSKGMYSCAGSDCHRFSSLLHQFDEHRLPKSVAGKISRLLK